MHLAITAINSTTGPNEDGAQVEAKITVDADDPFDVSPTDQSHGSVTASSTGAAPHLMLAAEALVLYLRSLSFLQAAIQKAKAFWEQRRASLQDAGTDFNEGRHPLILHQHKCSSILLQPSNGYGQNSTSATKRLNSPDRVSERVTYRKSLFLAKS